MNSIQFGAVSHDPQRTPWTVYTKAGERAEIPLVVTGEEDLARYEDVVGTDGKVKFFADGDCLKWERNGNGPWHTTISERRLALEMLLRAGLNDESANVFAKTLVK